MRRLADQPDVVAGIDRAVKFGVRFIQLQDHHAARAGDVHAGHNGVATRLATDCGDAFIASELGHHLPRGNLKLRPTMMMADEHPPISHQLHVPRLRVADRDGPVVRWVQFVDVEQSPKALVDGEKLVVDRSG